MLPALEYLGNWHVFLLFVLYQVENGDGRGLRGIKGCKQERLLKGEQGEVSQRLYCFGKLGNSRRNLTDDLNFSRFRFRIVGIVVAMTFSPGPP